MPTQPRPYVDFQELKRAVTIPDVLATLGLLDRFRRTGDTLTGVCPLPDHRHGPYPNAEQFKATIRDGVWLWHCFGDCQRGGDVIELAKALTGYSNAHIRLWFYERWGDRLSARKPQNGRDKPPGEKEEAREVVQTPQRAKVKTNTNTVPTADQPIKPLRFKLRLDPAVPYLRERGLTDETIARFGLGLCTRGLLAGYVAIPVYRYPRQSPDENPVAYLGRWPGDDFDEAAGRPRYRWPAGFPKHQFVYGLAEALETASDMPLVVVEGAFGVYHLVQAGFPASVAVFGSDLSDEQVALLLATGRPIVLMFDGDEAGRAGMQKAADKLLSSAFVHTVLLADGQQPDALSPAELGAVIPASL